MDFVIPHDSFHFSPVNIEQSYNFECGFNLIGCKFSVNIISSITNT